MYILAQLQDTSTDLNDIYLLLLIRLSSVVHAAHHGFTPSGLHHRGDIVRSHCMHRRTLDNGVDNLLQLLHRRLGRHGASLILHHCEPLLQSKNLTLDRSVYICRQLGGTVKRVQSTNPPLSLSASSFCCKLSFANPRNPLPPSPWKGEEMLKTNNQPCPLSPRADAFG